MINQNTEIFFPLSKIIVKHFQTITLILIFVAKLQHLEKVCNYLENLVLI